MLVHSTIDYSEVNGPGRRAVIHVQGCKLGCPGCWNPETHLFPDAPVYPDHRHPLSRSVSSLVDWISTCIQKNGITGLTISGGEPIHQVNEVSCLVNSLQRTFRGFSIGIFSGYTEKELNAGKYYWRQMDMAGGLAEIYKHTPKKVTMHKMNEWRGLRNKIDFAILGRYNQDKPDVSEQFISSTNQEIKLYSFRYAIQDFDSKMTEVSIEEDGLVTVTGFPILGLPK